MALDFNATNIDALTTSDLAGLTDNEKRVLAKLTEHQTIKIAAPGTGTKMTRAGQSAEVAADSVALATLRGWVAA